MRGRTSGGRQESARHAPGGCQEGVITGDMSFTEYQQAAKSVRSASSGCFLKSKTSKERAGMAGMAALRHREQVAN